MTTTAATATAVDLSVFAEDALKAVLAYRQLIYSRDVRDELDRHEVTPQSAVEDERHRRAMDASLERRDEATCPIRMELRRRRREWERLCDEALGPEWRL